MGDLKKTYRTEYSEQVVERAKKEKRFLLYFKLDGSLADRSSIEFNGDVSDEQADELFNLINKWREENKL